MYCYITQERALQRALAKAHAVIDGLREKVRGMEEEAGRAAAGIASRDVDCARKDAEIARKDAEIARKDAEIARLRAMLEKEGIEIKRLKASEAYHDNAHAPTSKGTLTMRQMQKEAVEGRRRASTGRRPGRERGHEGTTSKIGPGAPVEDRFCEARRCHVCGGTDLVERTATKQHVDVRIVADERWLRLHDLECAGCGTVLRAPRDGTVDGASAGGELLAVIGGLHADCHGTAGTIGAFLRNVLGIRMGAPAVHNAINVIGRGIRPRARAIRDAAEMRADPSEADETVMTTAVERGPEEDGSPPGTGRNRVRLEFRRGYLWVDLSRSAARVHASPSRAAAVFEENYPDRVRGPTTHDRLAQYDRVCRVSQADWVHMARYAVHAVIRAAGDPAKRAAAERLHGLLVAAFKWAKREAAGHGGAFQDPLIREKAQRLEDEVAAIAEAYKAAGIPEMHTYLSGAAGCVSTFMLYPGMSADSTGVERFIKWLIGWRNSGGRTVTAEGREIFSDIATVAGTDMVQGRSYADDIREALGVPPPPEYATVRAEGSRRRMRAAPAAPAASRAAGGADPSISASPPRWRRRPLAGGGTAGRAERAAAAARAAADAAEAKARADAEASKAAAARAREAAEAAAARAREAAEEEEEEEEAVPESRAATAKAATAKAATAKAATAKRRTERRRTGGAGMGGAPAPRQRSLAIANVPEAAAAADKACKRRPLAQPHPSTAHAAPSAAPSGPGPPPSGGQRALAAAA